MHVKKLTQSVIIQTLEKHREELRRYGVKSIALFGSFIRNKTHKGSDLDFLVTFDEETFDHYIELKFFLEGLFHKKVDVVIETALKPRLSYVKEEAIYAKGL